MASFDRQAESLSLEDQVHLLRGRQNGLKKLVRPKNAYTAEYWAARCKLLDLDRKLVEVEKQLSVRDSRLDERTWSRTSEGLDFAIKLRAVELERKAVNEQAQRIDAADPRHRVFVKLFTTSPLGLGIKTGMGQRDNKLQSRFREQLISLSCATHPDPESSGHLWCPVMHAYYPAEHVTASHIFGYGHGEDIMVHIFGEEVRGELFSAQNGLLLYDLAETRYDRGRFVILPDIESPLTQANVEIWEVSKPRNYVIKVVNPGSPDMTTRINSDSDLLWNGLDGRKLVFKSDFRPRTRFLYFHYLKTMLKSSWEKETDVEALKNELGFPMWATPGKYIADNMLLALVKEVGHKYSSMIQATTSPSGEETDEKELQKDPMLLITIARQIGKCLCFDGDESPSYELDAKAD